MQALSVCNNPLLKQRIKSSLNLLSAGITKALIELFSSCTGLLTDMCLTRSLGSCFQGKIMINACFVLFFTWIG